MTYAASERYKKSAPITPGGDDWFASFDRRRKTLAAEGSAQLLERCNALYRRFGERHGLPLEDARKFQLQGYRP